jgi:Holliday junction resolvase RusA-like endonuclease
MEYYMFDNVPSKEEVIDAVKNNRLPFDTSDYTEKDIEKIIARMNEILNEDIYEIKLVYEDIPKGAKRPKLPPGFEPGKKRRPYDADKIVKRHFASYIREQIGEDWKLIKGEVSVLLEVFRPSIKSFSKVEKVLAEMKLLRPAKKPDTDNYAKLYMDSLKMILWEDDGQDIRLIVNKYYSARPRVEMTIQYRRERVTKK